GGGPPHEHSDGHEARQRLDQRAPDVLMNYAHDAPADPRRPRHRAAEYRWTGDPGDKPDGTHAGAWLRNAPRAREREHRRGHDGRPRGTDGRAPDARGVDAPRPWPGRRPRPR